ncbi:MAG: glycosyltransferase [Methanohalophilus sp.]|nr:MAG: glycosyltransferase [Methanohalophilus sp.]
MIVGLNLKILRVAADIYPDVVGGVGLHVHEMSKEQAHLGNRVDVYTAGNSDRSAEEKRDGYTIKRFKPLMKLLGNSIMPNMFSSIYKNRHAYDIIHAHSHLYFSTNLCALVRKLGSAPLVITNHGLNSQTAPPWFQDIYTATGAKFTFNAADKIICYTESEKKELLKLKIPADKIEVIHNGIDTEHFVPAEEPVFDEKKLLWIGRYANGKGVDYLIDAFSILQSKHPDATLTMVGKGPDKERILQKIQDLNLEKYITIKDFIPNSEIVQLYQECSVFVLPSLEEGVPRTILEAMACGIPVVCTQLPQLMDIVEDSGYLVPVKDAQVLADRICEILSDSDLAMKLGSNGRENVVANYSWKDTVKKTIGLYEGLI